MQNTVLEITIISRLKNEQEDFCLKGYKVRKYFIYFVIGILIFVILGLVISCVIYKITKISFSDINTMVASALGAVITLAGIIITIKETNKQNKKMHENQIKAYEQSLEDLRNKEVMPYFFLYKIDKNDSRMEESSNGIVIGLEENEEKTEMKEYGRLIIENIGNGPALRLSIRESGTFASYVIDNQYIKPGESKSISLMVFHKIVDFKKQEDYLNFTTKDVQIEICCRDIYNNEYVWEVDLKTHRDISTDAKDITNKDNYKEIYDMEIRGQKLKLKNDINMNYD